MTDEDNIKNRPYICYHCGRECKNWNALVAHLQYCEKRNLRRTFEFEKFRAEIYLNPKRRYVNALRMIQSEYPEKSELFIGAVLFMEKAELLNSCKFYPKTKITKKEDK